MAAAALHAGEGEVACARGECALEVSPSPPSPPDAHHTLHGPAGRQPALAWRRPSAAHSPSGANRAHCLAVGLWSWLRHVRPSLLTRGLPALVGLMCPSRERCVAGSAVAHAARLVGGAFFRSGPERHLAPPRACTGLTARSPALQCQTLAVRLLAARKSLWKAVVVVALHARVPLADVDQRGVSSLRPTASLLRRSAPRDVRRSALRLERRALRCEPRGLLRALRLAPPRKRLALFLPPLRPSSSLVCDSGCLCGIGSMGRLHRRNKGCHGRRHRCLLAKATQTHARTRKYTYTCRRVRTC